VWEIFAIMCHTVLTHRNPPVYSLRRRTRMDATRFTTMTTNAKSDLGKEIIETRRRYLLRLSLYGARSAERLRVKLTTLLLKAKG
jgi:hypothetical protein